MDPQRRVLVAGATAPLEALRGVEALIVVDTSAWSQLGTMAEVVRGFRGPRAVIDHHVSEDDFGAAMFKDATAEATGRLILELAEFLGVKVTTEMAEPLFAAIATDTGWFRFSSRHRENVRGAGEAGGGRGESAADVFAALRAAQPCRGCGCEGGFSTM